MYWCLTLSEETKNKLLKIAKTFDLIPEGWNIYADHITLIHSSSKNFDSASKLLSNFTGHAVKFSILGIGISDGVVAFEVDTRTENRVPHITIATSPSTKPVASNTIEIWNRLYCDEEFYGTLTFKA